MDTVSSGSGDGNNKLQLSLKNQRDDDYDDDSDSGDDGAELLAAAEECFGSDRVMSILHKNPALIHIGNLVGDTVLHLVARAGYLETVCNLIAWLQKHGDWELKDQVLEDQNGDGDTAYHLALKNGHREIASRLIEVDKLAMWITNNDGINPYNLAEQAGICKRCSIVSDVDMGAMKKDLVGVSVSLHWIKLYKAIMEGEANTLITGLNRHSKELLMQHDLLGGSLLHAAVTASGMEPLRRIVEFMIRDGLTDAAFLRNKYGDTALHKAVDDEEWSKAACLIPVAPETVYQVNHEGISPLYLVVKRGHQDIVKLMLSQSCLVDCASETLKHPKHSTLAHLAIKVRSFGTLQTLMDHLPNLVDEKDEKGWRPLSYAAYRGYLEEVIYFLSNFSKSAKKYDKDGSLPIHKAIAGRHFSVVEAFISHYPKSLYHVTKQGQSVLHITARYTGRSDMLAYLEKEVKTDEAFRSLRDHLGKTYSDYT